MSAGEELRELSRLLFDAAANRWYTALGMELAAGLGSAVLDLVGLQENVSLLLSGLLVFVLFAAYLLQLRASDLQGRAETMRRQAVFTEALAWPISRVQLSEWRRRAGQRIRSQLTRQPPDADYYATKEAPGPKRLLEMTQESAFYTRHVYGNVATLGTIALVVVAALAAIAVIVLVAAVLAPAARVLVARALYAVIPLFVGVDILGWRIRLGSKIKDICQIEESVEELIAHGGDDERAALQWVAEYNCAVADGIPVLNRLLRRWHDDIEREWKSYLGK